MASSFKLSLNVLGYQAEGEWVALALEMDIRGFGPTFEDAVDDLEDLVRMQVSFAAFKREPSLLSRPAAPAWFALFAQVRQNHLESIVRLEDDEDSEYRVSGIDMPPAHVIASLQDSFEATYS